MKPLFACFWGLSLLSVAMLSTSVYAQWSGGLVRGGEGEEWGEEILERYRYLYTKHAGGPGRYLAPDAYERAVQEKQQFDQAHPSSPSQILSAWTSLNPAGMFYSRTNANYISGRTNSMAFHPTDPNTFYCAAAGGGVWKTTNGGANWTVLTDGLPSLMSGSIAIDPLSPNTLYYGTGELNFSLDSYYGAGVFKTTNAGTTWTQIATTGTVGSYVSQITVFPTNSSLVFLSGSAGVYKSTNAGATWTSTSSGLYTHCVIVDPTNSQVMYTSVDGLVSFYGVVEKTTNGGASWTILGGGLPSSDVGRILLAMAPNDHNTLYASIAAVSTGGLLGLYRTTDGGTTWTPQATTPNYLSSQGWYDNSVCVKPTDANTVIVGGLDIYKSTTGGTGLLQMTLWSTTTSSTMSHADIHFLGYNGSTLYCGSDGGVYKSTNDGVTWTDLNATISSLQYQSADYDPVNSNLLYGGCQDNNKQTSTDGGLTWNQRTTGDGGYTVVDPVITTINYGQYVGGSCQRSNNSGVSYTEIRPSLGSGGLFYNPYEMAPGDPQTLVYGDSQVWKTTTARTATSASWTQIASAATVGSTRGVSAIGISWTNTSKIYVGTDNGRILATTNNGSTWTTTTGYPYVSDLAVDPTNDNICYATFTGFTAGTHVYKTTNSGVSWFSISGTFPNIPTNTIVVVPQTPRWLFVGTDLGVYQSTNDGASWTSFNSGLPTLTVYDLKYKDGAKLLMAATHGRGCFMNDLSAALPIQLASFTGRYIGGNAVRLDWGTVSELNNYGFEIQRRSANEIEFTTLPNSFVLGHGTTNEYHTYYFIDSLVAPNQWSYRLKQIDLDGTAHYSEPVSVTVLTSVQQAGLASVFALDQNYPNPFNPTTLISYELPSAMQVSLKVYDVLGQEVAVLASGMKSAGPHQVEWNAAGFASGIYFYRLEAGSFVSVRRMSVMK